MNERCQTEMDNLPIECMDVADIVLAHKANMMIFKEINRSARPLEFLLEGEDTIFYADPFL